MTAVKLLLQVVARITFFGFNVSSVQVSHTCTVMIFFNGCNNIQNIITQKNTVPDCDNIYPDIIWLYGYGYQIILFDYFYCILWSDRCIVIVLQLHTYNSSIPCKFKGIFCTCLSHGQLFLFLLHYHFCPQETQKSTQQCESSIQQL